MYRQELGENGSEAILAPGRSFLSEKNNTSSLFDFSALPFHGIRWDLWCTFTDVSVCVRVSACVFVRTDLAGRKPFLL